MDQLHILVVDDNRINRLYLKTILTQWHHHVTEVNSGLSALSACQHQSFDLILMDIRMQPMDGVTAAEKIKELEQHNNTPIVAVSAEYIDCAPYPQFIQCLTKPLNNADLKALIDPYKTSSHHDKKHTSPFDEERALAISHHDKEIVNKLRALFINELAVEIKTIEHLHHSGLRQELDNQLHHLQGSARVCAAEDFCQHIKYYRQQLKTHAVNELDNCLKQLKQAASEILTSDTMAAD
ncbi:MAG: response regulator [Proteobacteria bacterium]|nr:response regulator [Pseudomonadota bacterium]